MGVTFTDPPNPHDAWGKRLLTPLKENGDFHEGKKVVLGGGSYRFS
jgi:hypothetical protein